MDEKQLDIEGNIEDGQSADVPRDIYDALEVIADRLDEGEVLSDATVLRIGSGGRYGVGSVPLAPVSTLPDRIIERFRFAEDARLQVMVRHAAGYIWRNFDISTAGTGERVEDSAPVQAPAPAAPAPFSPADALHLMRQGMDLAREAQAPAAPAPPAPDLAAELERVTTIAKAVGMEKPKPTPSTDGAWGFAERALSLEPVQDLLSSVPGLIEMRSRRLAAQIEQMEVQNAAQAVQIQKASNDEKARAIALEREQLDLEEKRLALDAERAELRGLSVVDGEGGADELAG